jgi:phospholipase C
MYSDLNHSIVILAIAAAGCGPVRRAGSCDGPCPQSRVNHLIVVIQENHTFDSYFGRYCVAATGSNPSCEDGPGCCEAGPASEPSGSAPVTLDDAANARFDPAHDQACELLELDGGKMDGFVTNTHCGDARNFAYAPQSVIGAYWQLAGNNALADHWFQPIAGQSSSNDMYLARAQYVFTDNDFEPDAAGKQCSVSMHTRTYGDPTIGDLLDAKSVSWAFYAEGYQAMLAATKSGQCPQAPNDCDANFQIYPCVYEPGDVPFQYYSAFKDNPVFMRDYSRFAADLSAGKLPQVSFVKAIGYRSEHPGLTTTVSAGVKFVSALVAAVQQSDYAADSIVLVLYDEGGGFFDHVAPPPASAVDQQPYGTRVPLLAIGPMARKNHVSHVVMEHSSIVRFIEWNWLGATGQLGGRDATVANLGSLLQPATGVPEQ